MDDRARQIEPLIPGLRRYAWALTRDHASADDLVQGALERALSRWLFRRDRDDPKAWLYAILRNLYLDGLRADRRRPGPLAVDAADLARDEGGDPERALIARDALARLDALPEEQRSLLLLVGVEDLSYEEAARATGVPVGTVMSRLSRARAALRRQIEGRGAILRRVK